MLPAILSLALSLTASQPAEPTSCEERAELAWHISGEQDAAWEDAIAECEAQP